MPYLAIPGIASMTSHCASVLEFFLPSRSLVLLFFLPGISMRYGAIGVPACAVMSPYLSFGTCFALLLKVSVPKDVDGDFPHWSVRVPMVLGVR